MQYGNSHEDTKATFAAHLNTKGLLIMLEYGPVIVTQGKHKGRMVVTMTRMKPARRESFTGAICFYALTDGTRFPFVP